MIKPEYKVQQGFGENAAATYIRGGLRGHSGIDYSGGYGAEIHAIFPEEYIYKILDENRPANDGSGFTGVFSIIDDGVECFEFLYGHGDPKVTVGQICHRGDVIMTEANHGECYVGGLRITLEMQKKGDKRGAHVHAQKRMLRKDKKMIPNGTQYLIDNSGSPLFYNGFYYAIPYHKNGYNGCVDWTASTFNRNLMVGSSGYDVQCLQNFLKNRGFLQIETTTDYFGGKTMQGVMAFQKANNLTPVGIVGRQTRQLINNILNYGN